MTKQELMRKTHYGLTVYAHILRQYYPEQTLLQLSGRECGICRNPFAGNAQTLQIRIEKQEPGTPLSPERATHHDTQNAIPDGDALHFAALHYRQEENQLLHTLCTEMNLLGKQNKQPGNHTPATPKQADNPLISFFKGPITNTAPYKNVSLTDIYRYITGNYAKQRTAQLRNILALPDSQNQARKFKATQFDYCTFSGTFAARHAKSLLKPSGLLCLDFDHLPDTEQLFNRLLSDEYFDTQLLFRSPSGNGLKWIVKTNNQAQMPHAHYFQAVANYIFHTYAVKADRSGSDIARACFLPHDPNCFINPDLY